MRCLRKLYFSYNLHKEWSAIYLISVNACTHYVIFWNRHEFYWRNQILLITSIRFEGEQIQSQMLLSCSNDIKIVWLWITRPPQCSFSSTHDCSKQIDYYPMTGIRKWNTRIYLVHGWYKKLCKRIAPLWNKCQHLYVCLTSIQWHCFKLYHVFINGHSDRK